VRAVHRGLRSHDIVVNCLSERAVGCANDGCDNDIDLFVDDPFDELKFTLVLLWCKLCRDVDRFVLLSRLPLPSMIVLSILMLFVIMELLWWVTLLVNLQFGWWLLELLLWLLLLDAEKWTQTPVDARRC